MKIIEIKKQIIKKIYKPRPLESKKYDFGLLIVIGGSEFYTGSPALVSLAAFRAGVDMVRILAPKRAADIIASFSPNLACYPLKGSKLTKQHLSTLIEFVKSAEIVSEGKTAVVIGGGLGRSKETQKVVREFLSQISVPCVIDADAIYAISSNLEILKGKKCLLTPHSYEFYILTGEKIKDLKDVDKIKKVKEKASALQVTILLKGKIDIISDGEKVGVNKMGCPFLTVGGTGDVLAGIAGSLLARGVDVFESGCCASFLNGFAGVLASKEFGESLTATDLINFIPKAIKNLTK